MPDVRLLVACRQVLVDTFSNAASAIGILDSLTLASVPAVLPGLMVLAVLEKRNGDEDTFPANVTVRLNGAVLASSPGSVSFAGQRMARIVADLGNLVLATHGELRFSLETPREESLGEYVVAIEPPVPNLFERHSENKGATSN